MANARTGGMAPPEDENGSELQHEQQNEEDRRRQHMLQDGLAGNSVSADQEPLPQPTRSDPGAAPAHAQSEALPSNWQDILAERLTKLNDGQRAKYDRQMYGATERNLTVSPQYPLDLAVLLGKNMPTMAEGRDLHELNRREDALASRRHEQELKKALAPQQRPADRTSTSSAAGNDPRAVHTTSRRQSDSPPHDATSPRSANPAVRREAGLRAPHLASRKAAPDRTKLVHKRFQQMLDHHAERRRELKLPPNRAEQNEFGRLDFHQDAARKALRDQQSMELKLLDYQHVAERTAVAAQWLARDLERARSPDAAIYKKEAAQALRAMGLAYERRQTLVAKGADAFGWENAASSSTNAGPVQTQEGRTNQRDAATQSRQPVAAPPQNTPTSRSQDPTDFFKDGHALPTEDRLRGMLGRYEELRENRSMPSGVNEDNEQSRLTTLQATVQKNVLAQQSKLTQLLDYQHLAERAGTSAEWLARSSDQPRYRAQARRAFSIARLALDRRDAIDPRARADNDRRRAAGEQADRQARVQEAAKGGSVLSSEERASFPASVASAARDRHTRTNERFAGAAKQDGGRSPGGPQNSRGGGGRGR